MSGEGIPLILIHGGTLDKRMWDDQFNEFAKHFKVIRYDARKHGLTESEPDTFSHHEDLNMLMEKLGINKAVILGLSMGGYVSINFALTHPEKVIALIPVSPGLTGYEFKDKEILENQEKMKQAQTYEEVVEYIQRSWTDGPYRTPAQIDSTVREKARMMYFENITNMKRGFKEVLIDPPASQRLKEISVPTFVIVGDLDMPGIIEISDMILRDVKNSERLIINGAAHLVNMEKPAEFNKAVIDFISGVVK
jgi:3-oxoadipate enol-lactonase